MANHMYNYGSSYGGAGYSAAYSDAYNGRTISASDRYSDASLLGSSRYLSHDAGSERWAGAPSYNVNGYAAPQPVDPSALSGLKRPAEALYHQTILGTHNNTGQNEALFAANTLAKRTRFETASNLPIYPERPGEKDCAFYMLTRTCKYGLNCKFDHPRWVPEGGIPDWKEIPLLITDESLPERPGEPDCPFYMKTQKCKFGLRCKFNHPKSQTDPTEGGLAGVDVQIPLAGQDAGVAEQKETAAGDNGAEGGDSKATNPFFPFTPAMLHNSKGLPVRPEEPDCPFYVKTGSCKYGATCRYNHPDRAYAAALGQAIVPSAATNLPFGVLNPVSNILPNIDPRLTQTTVAMSIYPQRPGQPECDFYMKSGQCKFGERCKFHHPIDRSAPTSQEPNVKLTLAGLPRREGAVACPYYMKTGACKYAVNCRFDHPPPGEAIAMASAQAGGAVAAVVAEAAAAEGQD